MVKFILKGSVALALALSSQVFADEVAVNSIAFADANLKSCVFEAAQQQGHTLASEFTELRCGKKNIAAISGIEHFSNLTFLDLSLNQIEDIADLSGINNLKTLFLGDNQISDITALTAMTSLTDLSLRTNKISDLTSLSGLTQLTNLYLWQNQITDLTPLGGLLDIKQLWLQYNQIGDISPLASITGLTLLDLANNELTNIAALDQMNALTSVNLMANNNLQCADLDGLATRLPNAAITRPVSCISPYLKDVVFSDAQLQLCVTQAINNNGWQLISEMVELRCGNKGVQAIDGIEKLTSLTTLDLSINQISDISLLAGLTGLKVLYLGDNLIHDIAPLAQLTALTDLSLRTNQIEDVSPLSGMKSLQKLYIWQNRISDISALANLSSLTHLWIASNKISDITALGGLTKLTFLSIANNQISDIAALATLSALTTVDLQDNLVGDTTVLVSLPLLTSINLTGNETVSCSALDDLEQQFGEGAVTRPSSCYSTALSSLQFSDAKLKTCVAQYAASKGWSTVYDLVELQCINQQLSNLTGLEQLTELTFLNLSGNNIVQLSPIANLADLKTLYLGDNQISSLTDLRALSKLENLSLRANPVSDITPLTNLHSLKKLYLRENNIADIAALAGLTEITHLWLSTNQISDISFLSNLTEMTELSLYGNRVNNIDALLKMNHLSMVDLRLNNDIKCSDLTSLENRIGSSALLKPTSCIPDGGLTELNYYSLSGKNLSGNLNKYIQSSGSLTVLTPATLGQFTINAGQFSYESSRTGTDIVELAVLRNNQPYEILRLNLQVGERIIKDGYPAKIQAGGQLSYGYSGFPGETISWYLNGLSRSQQQITITNVLGQVVDTVSASLQGQSINNAEPWINGYGYQKTFDYTIPADMKSGVYFLAGHKDLFFVVKSVNPGLISVLIPTNTINAYSCAGGHSLYNCSVNGTIQSAVPKLTFMRPIVGPSEDDTFRAIFPALEWLAGEQTLTDDITYFTDYEMDQLSHYRDSKMLMVLGHNEYWTHKAQRNFDEYTQKLSKNAWVAGGNVMWWASRYENSGNTLVSYKYLTDVDATDPSDRTIYFTSLGIHQANSIGGNFDYGGYDRNLMDSQAKPNAMKINKPNSPLFQNTGISLCHNLDMSENGEFDGAPLAGFDIDGLPVAQKDFRGIYRLEIVGYAWGSRSAHTMGTMHVLQSKPDAGVVVQFGSIGAAHYGFTKDHSGIYRKIVSNVVNLLTSDNAEAAFSSDIDTVTDVAYPFATPMPVDNTPNFVERCAR